MLLSQNQSYCLNFRNIPQPRVNQSMDIKVKKRNGRLEEFEVDKINASAQRACYEIEDVSPSEIVLDAQLQLFDKITTKEIDTALILSAREKIEKGAQLFICRSKTIA